MNGNSDLQFMVDALEMKRDAGCYQQPRAPETHKAMEQPMSMSFDGQYSDSAHLRNKNVTRTQRGAV